MSTTAKMIKSPGEHNDCAQKWGEKVANCRGSGCQRHHQHNSVWDHQNYRDHYLGYRGARAGQGKYNTTAKGRAPWGGACSWLCLIDQIIISNMIRLSRSATWPSSQDHHHYEESGTTKANDRKSKMVANGCRIFHNTYMRITHYQFFISHHVLLMSLFEELSKYHFFGW